MSNTPVSMFAVDAAADPLVADSATADPAAAGVCRCLLLVWGVLMLQMPHRSV
jgi:hypothetical protein